MLFWGSPSTKPPVSKVNNFPKFIFTITRKNLKIGHLIFETISSLGLYSQILSSMSFFPLSSCSVSSLPIFGKHTLSKLMSPVYSSKNMIPSTILKTLNSLLHKKSRFLVNIEHHPISMKHYNLWPWTQLGNEDEIHCDEMTLPDPDICPLLPAPRGSTANRGPTIHGTNRTLDGWGPAEQPHLIGWAQVVFQQWIIQRLVSLRTDPCCCHKVDILEKMVKFTRLILIKYIIAALCWSKAYSPQLRWAEM